MFYPGDTYHFILNIPTGNGTTTITSPPVITVLDITNPGVPIVTAAAMTFVTGTSFVYFYSFVAPNTTPRDYVGIYSYSTSTGETVGTATATSWQNGVITYTFPLPLPEHAVTGNVLTASGFTASGFNVTNAPIVAANRRTGQVSALLNVNPAGSEVFNLTGNAQILAGIPNVATIQLTQITNGIINPGDSVAIASATSSTLNGTYIVRTAVLDNTVWTVTFNTTASAFASTPQSAGTLTDAIGIATVLGTASVAIQVVVSNQVVSLADELHIGDSNISGQVALNATVALNSTVAKDATVLKAVQYTSPSNDALVQTIATQTATIFTNSGLLAALMGTLQQGTVSGLLQDVYDNLFGSWNIDQTVNPPVLYIKRINGDLIASFQLVNNNTVTQRNVLTNPAESSF